MKKYIAIALVLFANTLSLQAAGQAAETSTEGFISKYFYGKKPLVMKSSGSQESLALTADLITDGHTDGEYSGKNSPELNKQEPAGIDLDLLNAVKRNAKVEVIKDLLSRQANPNTQDQYGYTLLHIAAGKPNSLETVIALVEAGLDVNARSDGDAYTRPLHRAAENGNAGVVEYLLYAGADRTLQDWTGRTAEELVTEWDIQNAFIPLTEKRYPTQRPWEKK